MKQRLQDLRKDFVKGELSLDSLAPDPIKQLQKWLSEAMASEEPEPSAMSLSTVAVSGAPRSRMVLLKGVEQDGLVFYTNYNSDKGKELAHNPMAAALLFWPQLERQIRVEGRVEKVAAAVSDEYFATRPRESRIGAWASPQSSLIESYDKLRQAWIENSTKFEEEVIPRPEHWGGYLLRPGSFEFWQGRPGRLHQRFRYRKEGSLWAIDILAP